MATREQAFAILAWLSAVTSIAIATYGVYTVYKKRTK